MTDTRTDLRTRNVGDIASELAGATTIFRSHNIDFCCHGSVTLDEAARQRGLDADAIAAELSALDPRTEPEAPSETDELIRYIQDRYHAKHRKQLPELLDLARAVEQVHARHPDVPAGLADALQKVWGEIEVHMKREELLIFPAMRRQRTDGLDAKIGDLRHEHDDQGEFLDLVARLTHDYTPPEDACRSWQALYKGAAQLRVDLMEHIHLENNVLFPRFEDAA